MANFLKPLRLSDLPRPETIDLQASVARLSDQVTAAVDERFPGSAIIVAYLEERDGVLYLTADGTIGGAPPADEVARRRLEDEVDRIAAPIFDSYDWVVWREAE